MKTNNEISNARYYANAAEQQILIQGLQRYFSLPERSQNRNKITKEVSQFLRCFSPHWSHRAVRLWFNNNKHSYFNNPNACNENTNNPAGNIPIVNNIPPSNIKMNINNQNFETPLPNNVNIIPNNASYLKIPMYQHPNHPQQSSNVIQGIQYPNSILTNEKGDINSIQTQGNVLQQTLGAIAPTLQNLIPASISLKDQQHQKIKQEHRQQPQPKPKQQLIIPQINTTNSVSQIVPTQVQPSNSAPGPISSSVITQPAPPPYEIKLPPKIPQPQIQQPLRNSVQPTTSSLTPGHFQRIPTPQIDGTLYNESSNNNNSNSSNNDNSKASHTKKKVTVMPPIKISSTSPLKSPASTSNIPTSNSSISFWPNNNNNTSNYGRGSSLEPGITRERMCKQITALLKDIRETPEDQMSPTSLLKMKINEFEQMCRSFRTQFGFLSPQIIDPSFKFTRFPVHDPLRDMPASLSSMSFSLLSASGMNDDNDGYNNDLNGFMYNNMGSLGSLSGFGRSESNFSLNTFSPSTSMNLINDTAVAVPAQIQDNPIFDAGRDENMSNFEIFGKPNDSENKSGTPESSSPSFAPSTSSSIDASMSNQANNLITFQQNKESNNNSININSDNGQSNNNTGFIDQISTSHIWQARGYKNTHIPYFECTALSRGIETAAYVYKNIDFNISQNKRTVCFTNVRRNNNNNPNDDCDWSVDAMHDSWKTVLVDCKSVVESMAVDCNSAWLLTNHEIIHTSLSNNNDCCSLARIEIPQSSGSRSLSLIGDGIVACFSSLSDLFFVSENNSHEIQRVKTNCSGISCMAALSNDLIACGVPLNGTISLFNINGNEIRSFVGHCGPVMGVYPLFSSGANFQTNLFASRADDNTVRVWDIRERVPIFQITTSLSLTSNSVPSSNSQTSMPNSTSLSKISTSVQQAQSSCSFLNVGGNDQYVILGLHNQIGVVDIRKDFAKPILGVTTDDYDAVSLGYNQELNAVAMFGEVGNIASKDSMLFIGNDGQSRKRIFRTYNNFIG